MWKEFCSPFIHFRFNFLHRVHFKFKLLKAGDRVRLSYSSIHSSRVLTWIRRRVSSDWLVLGKISYVKSVWKIVACYFNLSLTRHEIIQHGNERFMKNSQPKLQSQQPEKNIVTTYCCQEIKRSVSINIRIVQYVVYVSSTINWNFVTGSWVRTHLTAKVTEFTDMT